MEDLVTAPTPLDKRWLTEAVRLREEGHVFLGEAFVVPADDVDLTARLNAAADELYDCDWRIHQVVVTAVPAAKAKSAAWSRSSPTTAPSPSSA